MSKKLVEWFGGQIEKDEVLGYPRVCAHRGFNTVAPENTMPAWASAVAVGAPEIEFDLWMTKDGVIVSCHDPDLDRVSNGTGFVFEHTLSQLENYDFGCKFGEKFKGLKIVKFSDILEKFAKRVIMNIHVKTKGLFDDFDKTVLDKIVNLIDEYDCREYVYFMANNDNILQVAKDYYPDIKRCCGYHEPGFDMVERAIKYDCKKVQLFKPYFNQEMIVKAHENGIRCNVFYADEPEEAINYLNMGIDTILTNDYLPISNAIKEYLNEKK